MNVRRKRRKDQDCRQPCCSIHDQRRSAALWVENFGDDPLQCSSANKLLSNYIWLNLPDQFKPNSPVLIITWRVEEY